MPIFKLVAGVRMIVLVLVSSNGYGQQSEGGDCKLHHVGKVSLVCGLVRCRLSSWCRTTVDV